jgi:GLPGLI family protein
MKTFFFLCIPLITYPSLFLQAQKALYISDGVIEFERKVNLYAQLDKENPASADIKKDIPQFKTSYFTLSFSGDKTLYSHGRVNPANDKLWRLPAEDNIIYTDLDSNLYIGQKKIFDKVFLIHDSIRQIQWKMTDEKREIAGFECTRANAIILDSIYVVAFYADNITTPGGPESFTGLPGMIMGIALPHEHMTWFATKVSIGSIKMADLKPPAGGIKTTFPALKRTIQEGLKEWGKAGEQYLRAALL